MLSKFPAPIVYLVRNFHFSIALVLLSLCIFFWITSIFSFPLNADAGYYLTAGKYIVNGLVPYHDFHTSYSPGTFYIFGLADMLGSNFGEYHKVLIYFLHVTNGVLVSLILRKISIDNDLAILAGVLFILACFCLDGQALVLEPFQNVFILLSLLSAVSFRDYKAACYAGLLMGCALMSKQTSMFSLPIVAALIAFPMFFGLSSDQSKRSLLNRLTVFGAMIGFPFALFCLTTGQSFIVTFVKLATFGGRAQSYVAQKYGLYDAIGVFVSGNGGERLLIPIVVIAVLLTFISKHNLHRLFCAGVALNLITILFVRGSPHYIQLLIPWGVIVSVLLVKQTDPQNSLTKTLLCTLLVVPFIAPVLHTAHHVRLQFSIYPIESQKTLSAEIDQYLKNGSNTIVVGNPWLYYTSEITPPQYNLTFIKNKQQIEDRMDVAEQIVVMPGFVEVFQSVLAEKTSKKRFLKSKKINYKQQDVIIYSLKRN